jgi:RHS repeat-associated protein
MSVGAQVSAYGLSALATGFQSVTVTDELLRPATVHTDAYGQTIRSDRTLGGATVSTHYQYDLLGRLTGLTDNAGNQWSYTYDSLGRRLSANDPDLGAWTYSYDDAGRLTLQVDAKGQRTVLTYDALSRVKTKVTREGTAQAETTTITYDEARAGYYNVGQLTTLSNPAATIRYDHDKDGRLVRQQYVVDAVTHTLTNGYDISGRLLWRQFPDGDAIASAATPIAYDAAGRLKSVPGLVSDTAYDARSQVTSITRANAVNSTLTYSPQRGWLTALNTAKGATVIQDYGYTRDALGRITAVTSTQAGESWAYGYDDLDRLLSADNTTDNTLDQAWSYDSVDNMLTNSRVGSYSYPAPGSARPHAVSGVSGGPLGSQSFAYDANGNMTGQGGDVRVYDGENRLVSSTDGAVTVQYVYGPDGARLKKIAGSTTTLYLGADLEKTGTTWTKYLPGDAKRVGASSGPLYWMHRDHLLSVRAETNSAGTIVNSARYRPFGERLTSVATIPEAKGFIGERHDPETGLMYLNARYYDPALGRFMSADPLSPTLPGVGVNRYAYAFNNPIMMMDPSGLINFDPRDRSEVKAARGGRDTLNRDSGTDDSWYDDSWLEDPWSYDPLDELFQEVDELLDRFENYFEDHVLQGEFGWSATCMCSVGLEGSFGFGVQVDILDPLNSRAHLFASGVIGKSLGFFAGAGPGVGLSAPRENQMGVTTESSIVAEIAAAKGAGGAISVNLGPTPEIDSLDDISDIEDMSFETDIEFEKARLRGRLNGGIGAGAMVGIEGRIQANSPSPREVADFVSDLKDAFDDAVDRLW